MKKGKNSENKDILKKETIKKEESTEFKRVTKSKRDVDKEIEKMKKIYRKRKIRNIILAIILGSIILALLIFSTIFSFININNNNIIEGVSIEGIDMSGKSKDEAIEELEEIYNKKQEIKIKHGEYESTISLALIETEYKIETTVDNALSVGKDGNIFENNYNILFTKLNKKNIDIEMSINEEVAKQTIEDINVNLPDGLIESSYSVDEDELMISKGKAGVVVDEEKFLDEIKQQLKDTNSEEKVLEIPVINKEPEEIDIEKIHEEICKEPQDAYYTEDPFAVYPEVKGVDFDLESAKETLKEEKEEYVIKLTITEPEITLDKIGPEAFGDELATFSTRYDVSDEDRSTNLELACDKINGTVILAGETFSYNKVVGARTSGAGYKNAKVYEAGKVVDGIGGGICQISSTLYNAVLNANLEIVERKNHQFITSYVEPGKDATVVYGSVDFKFKNTRQYPIRLEATAKNGIATVSVYGIKEDQEYTFKLEVKRIATIPYKTEYIDDSSLPTGTEEIEQKGVNGLKTETYITKLLNGKTISTTLLSKDTYNAMTKIVRRGTK